MLGKFTWRKVAEAISLTQCIFIMFCFASLTQFLPSNSHDEVLKLYISVRGSEIHFLMNMKQSWTATTTQVNCQNIRWRHVYKKLTFRLIPNLGHYFHLHASSIIMAQIPVELCNQSLKCCMCTLHKWTRHLSCFCWIN